MQNLNNYENRIDFFCNFIFCMHTYFFLIVIVYVNTLTIHICKK